MQAAARGPSPSQAQAPGPAAITAHSEAQCQCRRQWLLPQPFDDSTEPVPVAASESAVSILPVAA